MVYYQTINGKRHKRDAPRFRPSTCLICHIPMEIKRRGRPRHYCSPRCRQRKSRRYNYHGYIDPRRQRLAWNKAGRTLRQWEHSGPYDDTRPANNPHAPSPRWRMQFYISRNIPLPICHTCNRLFIAGEGAGKFYCCAKCNRIGSENRKAVAAGVERYAESLGPVVEMRLRLGLELKTCVHCQRPFSPIDKRRKYCSTKCRKNAWWQRNPHWACKVCGKPCKGQQHTCSATCKNILHQRTAQFCFRCESAVKPGSEVLPIEDTRIPKRTARRFEGKPVIFCSYRCRDALGWSPVRKICEECREPYYPQHREIAHKQRFCTPKCKQHYHDRVKLAKARAARQPLYCRRCGDLIPGPYKKGRAPHFCSDTCRREGNKERNREYQRTRRASNATAA
jgi:predicted nucleic acid-binding Zn ribbon protein